jgi:post-segregation antitoxin (ccd killing protein)
MSTLLYLFKTHQINISNLAQAQALENADTASLDRCYYYFEENKFFKINLGALVTTHLKTPASDFRTIDWAETISSLNSYYERAQQQEKILIIGTARNDQISFLKQYYGSDILTIDVGYTESIYQNLLLNLAELHIHRLTQSPITQSNIDREILESKSTTQAINYYINAFDSQQLIPRSSDSVDTDYRILIDDYTNKLAMANHYRNIELPFTANSESFYDFWLANQTVF